LVDPKPGEVIRIDGRASVQFGADRALIFRVTKVSDAPTYCGWVWLAGYVLDDEGQAVERREIFVQRSGLRLLTPRPPESALGPIPGQASTRRPTAVPARRPSRSARA
jgi:hypothetical protein